MPHRTSILFAALAVALAVPACKSNDISETNTTNNAAGTSIGPQGGSVSGPDGSSVRVPAGALTAAVSIQIQVAEPGQYPPLPGDYTVAGKVYALLPHGTKFLTPVIVSLPASGAPAGAVGLHASANGSWSTLPAQLDGETAEISATSFSFFAVGTAAEQADAGGATCSGRGPDNSAPTGTLSGLSGTSGGLDLAEVVDGYAAPGNGVVGETGSFSLYLTKSPKACGSVKNGVLSTAAPILHILIHPQSGAVTTATYSGGDIAAAAYRADVAPGECGLPVVPSGGSSQGSVVLTALDATHVAGSFDFTPTSQAGAENIKGTFDLPICEPHAGLAPAWCCIE